MTKHQHISAIAFALLMLAAPVVQAQAVGGAERAHPVKGDLGISAMTVTETPEYSVARDFAEPGATRRMHSHAIPWHVFILVTGQLVLTVEGEPPVEVNQGQVISLKGGVSHGFKNTGTVTATIVEIFGKTKL